jgi:hypothetical protein
MAAFRLTFHLFHNRQTAVCSGADDKPVAFPRYLFFDGQGCMSKLVTESLGRRLLAFANLTVVYYHVLLVSAAVDPKGAEGKLSDMHTRIHTVASGALLRGVGREG